ncbi:MAG: hypothetical protein R2759_09005 [Bacteroidales bacterium]
MANPAGVDLDRFGNEDARRLFVRVPNYCCVIIGWNDPYFYLINSKG